jgi:hypothetical protein
LGKNYSPILVSYDKLHVMIAISFYSIHPFHEEDGEFAPSVESMEIWRRPEGRKL